MCGRYASARTRQELLEEFRVERDRVTESLQPDYNVAPTKPVYAVLTRKESGAREAAAPESAADESAASEPAAGESAGREPAGREPAGQTPAAQKPAAPGSAAPESAAAKSGAPSPDGQDAVRELRVVRWGLVPFWAKDLSIGSRLINARAETVSTKPAFRRAFARRRCLLPADGFYEWQAAGDGPRARKQPYFIHRADGSVLAFAGVYELWRDQTMPDGDPDAWLWTAAIITTRAQDEVGRIHDRMPMVIEPARWADWLDPGQADEAALHALLAPAVSSGLTSYPVSTEVNSVRHNGPQLMEPVDPDAEPAGTAQAGTAPAETAPAGAGRAAAGDHSDASRGAADRLF
ncbi:MAG TPA: SOS response-associated peptidase family protein [Streptosporangiaceae bacterium]